MIINELIQLGAHVHCGLTMLYLKLMGRGLPADGNGLTDPDADD
jgi:hypothetical protein